MQAPDEPAALLAAPPDPGPRAANGRPSRRAARRNPHAPAAQVVRRVLLRRGIAVGPDDGQAVADALQALFQALFQAAPPPPPARPRRPPAPAAACAPLFLPDDVPS